MVNLVLIGAISVVTSLLAGTWLYRVTSRLDAAVDPESWSAGYAVGFDDGFRAKKNREGKVVRWDLAEPDERRDHA